MASASIHPPEQFDFSKPDSWGKWIKRFERYSVAANVTSEEIKVNTLLYSMGPQAEDIMLSFNLSEEESKKYSVVKGKLHGHFVVRRNVIFERAKFNKRVQGENKSIDSDITDLYALIEQCGFWCIGGRTFARPDCSRHT